jgi:hypothetical protein
MSTRKYNVAFLIACMTIRPMCKQELAVRSRLAESTVGELLAYAASMGYTDRPAESAKGKGHKHFYAATPHGLAFLEEYRNNAPPPQHRSLKKEIQSKPYGRNQTLVYEALADGKELTVMEILNSTALTQRYEVDGALRDLLRKNLVFRVDTEGACGHTKGTTKDGKRIVGVWSRCEVTL